MLKKSCIRCASVILFSFDYDNELPIVLFVGQHFSGSLFESMHLSILTRERTKETRVRELGAPSPYLLGSLPNQLFLLSDVRSGSIVKAMLSLASLFPYPYPHPVGVLAELE